MGGSPPQGRCGGNGAFPPPSRPALGGVTAWGVAEAVRQGQPAVDSTPQALPQLRCPRGSGWVLSAGRGPGGTQTALFSPQESLHQRPAVPSCDLSPAGQRPGAQGGKGLPLFWKMIYQQQLLPCREWGDSAQAHCGPRSLSPPECAKDGGRQPPSCSSLLVVRRDCPPRRPAAGAPPLHSHAPFCPRLYLQISKKKHTLSMKGFFLSLISLKKQGTRKPLHQRPKPQTNKKRETQTRTRPHPHSQSNDNLTSLWQR